MVRFTNCFLTHSCFYSKLSPSIWGPSSASDLCSASDSNEDNLAILDQIDRDQDGSPNAVESTCQEQTGNLFKKFLNH